MVLDLLEGPVLLAVINDAHCGAFADPWELLQFRGSSNSRPSGETDRRDSRPVAGA